MEKRLIEWTPGNFWCCEYREGKGYWPLCPVEKELVKRLKICRTSPQRESGIKFWKLP